VGAGLIQRQVYELGVLQGGRSGGWGQASTTAQWWLGATKTLSRARSVCSAFDRAWPTWPHLFCWYTAGRSRAGQGFSCRRRGGGLSIAEALAPPAKALQGGKRCVRLAVHEPSKNREATGQQVRQARRQSVDDREQAAEGAKSWAHSRFQHPLA
jgi:hypothetical protein